MHVAVLGIACQRFFVSTVPAQRRSCRRSRSKRSKSPSLICVTATPSRVSRVIWWGLYEWRAHPQAAVSFLAWVAHGRPTTYCSPCSKASRVLTKHKSCLQAIRATHRPGCSISLHVLSKLANAYLFLRYNSRQANVTYARIF